MEENIEKLLTELIPDNKEVIEIAMLISDTRDPNVLTDIVASVDLIFDRMKERAGMGLSKEPKKFHAKNNIVFFTSEIEALQSEVHAITGDGEVMQCFNKMLGNQAT